MLRQEHTFEESKCYASPPASPVPAIEETRVSTDELIAAVAEIEARRDASQRWQADTIALGDAIHQLGLNMSPEELLAAVETVRARRFGEARAQVHSKARRRNARVTIAVFAILIAIPVLLIGLLVARQATPPAIAAQEAIRSATPKASGPPLTLNSLPPGITAYTDLGAIYELNHGHAPDGISLSRSQDEWNANLGVFRELWAVRVLNGKPYLQGWATKDANGQIRSITSAPPAGWPDQPTVTVPFSDLRAVRDPSRIVREDFGSKLIEVIDFTPEQARALHTGR